LAFFFPSLFFLAFSGLTPPPCPIPHWAVRLLCSSSPLFSPAFPPTFFFYSRSWYDLFPARFDASPPLGTLRYFRFSFLPFLLGFSSWFVCRFFRAAFFFWGPPPPDPPLRTPHAFRLPALLSARAQCCLFHRPPHIVSTDGRRRPDLFLRSCCAFLMISLFFRVFEEPRFSQVNRKNVFLGFFLSPLVCSDILLPVGDLTFFFPFFFFVIYIFPPFPRFCFRGFSDFQNPRETSVIRCSSLLFYVCFSLPRGSICTRTADTLTPFCLPSLCVFRPPRSPLTSNRTKIVYLRTNAKRFAPALVTVTGGLAVFCLGTLLGLFPPHGDDSCDCCVLPPFALCSWA